MDIENKRMLAFFLCGLILVMWMSRVQKSTMQRQVRSTEIQQAEQDLGPDERSSVVISPSATEAPQKKSPTTPSLKVAPREKRFELSSKDIGVVVSSAGGVVIDTVLKGYRRELKTSNRPIDDDVDRLSSENRVHVSSGFLSEASSPRVRITTDKGVVSDDQRSFYREENGQAIFRFEGENGITFEKRYTLDEHDFTLRFEVVVENKSGELRLIEPSITLAEELGVSELGLFDGHGEMEVAAYIGEAREREMLDAVDERQEYTGGKIDWIGIGDRYFMKALVPVTGMAEKVYFDRQAGDRVRLVDGKGRALGESEIAGYKNRGSLKLDQPLSDPAARGFQVIDRHEKLLAEFKLQDGRFGRRQLDLSTTQIRGLREAGLTVRATVAEMLYPQRKLSAGERARYEWLYFAGPKELELLEGLPNKLDRSIDLGDWIGFISRPLLTFMRFIYSFTGNYGVAIILLTLIVRAMLYPLTHVQYRSMKKMQALKPHLDELKERYKDSKEELNRQMIQLFKQQKVNPAGGCFPLLLQMPVFFALYRVLYNAIELRHAPFFGWLGDLSAKDPYFITPILMGAAMYFQMKMTPNATMEASQQMMMKMMPIIFTAFMLYLPSGLVVYIFVSTLLGLAQQWYVNRQPTSKAKAAA